MPRTLLVADDALIIRQIIKDMAASAGWTVVGEASNGQEAIDRYRQLRPDAVTLDLVMPEHDGLYALHGIMEFDPAGQGAAGQRPGAARRAEGRLQGRRRRLRVQALRQAEPAGHAGPVAPRGQCLNPTANQRVCHESRIHQSVPGLDDRHVRHDAEVRVDPGNPLRQERLAAGARGERRDRPFRKGAGNRGGRAWAARRR